MPTYIAVHSRSSVTKPTLGAADGRTFLAPSSPVSTRTISMRSWTGHSQSAAVKELVIWNRGAARLSACATEIFAAYYATGDRHINASV
jgi:hypothetical protein